MKRSSSMQPALTEKEEGRENPQIDYTQEQQLDEVQSPEETTLCSDSSLKDSSTAGKGVQGKRRGRPPRMEDFQSQPESAGFLETPYTTPAGRSAKTNKLKKRSRESKPNDIRLSKKMCVSHKPSLQQLQNSGEVFLQEGHCYEVAPNLPYCRDCLLTKDPKTNSHNIFCRFHYFRQLQYLSNGQLATAGFSNPLEASESDVKLWMPTATTNLEPDTALFLLSQVGDQFCDLIQEEMEIKEAYIKEGKKIVWKRVVDKVREMCDVCETTIFNFHWTCESCGFVVCVDCFQDRKSGLCKVWGKAGDDRDDFSWLLCTDRSGHDQNKLILTQIIAGDSLSAIGQKLHEARAQWNIPQLCDCAIGQELIKKDPVEIPAAAEEEPSATSDQSWLADLALSTKEEEEEDSSSSESDNASTKEGDNYSSLRKLLTRPKLEGSDDGSAGGSGVQSNAAITYPSSTTTTKPTTINFARSTFLPSRVPKPFMKDEGESSEYSDTEVIELKNFVRKKQYRSSGAKQIPLRVMTNVSSNDEYPDVPHQWLCDGKLLILQESANPNNYKIFQDQWKRGQPVMVLGISSLLHESLWHPQKFAEDFGEEKIDLINCMSGHVVPNTTLRDFWEGFVYFEKRLKDNQGVSMLLKLKDWPPSKDFADILPKHMDDLMRALPLGEYTQRTGRLNMASRLPDCFVRPDLGPKMYNAYGSALYQDKGTTNLHLDMSDAINVMVYAGSPQDVDDNENMLAAFRSIDEAGCDILTRRRVRQSGMVPGALWHIYNARDADRIRDLLNIVALERGSRLEPHHDPIHDQSWYLDGPLRERLYKEYSVEGYAIVQCMGEAIFIPAGAPHQVRNLQNCIKVAEDFVSPENVSHCFKLTQEFRDLSHTHTNHEDKLQIKNIMYHAVKDSLAVLAARAANKDDPGT